MIALPVATAAPPPGDLVAALAGPAMEVGVCSLRLLPVAALSPFLGGPILPPTARAALALALGAAVRASQRGSLPASSFALVASELALGAVLAVVASLPVEAARGAGRLVDTFRGATLGELHVAPVRQRETAIGDLLAWWTVALAAWAGADRLLLATLLDTFRSVPIGGSLHPAGPWQAVEAAAAILSAAICLGAPAAAALLVGDLALAVTARLAPQVAPVDAAPPLRAAIGLAAVALPSAAIGGRLVESVARAAEVLRALAGGSG